MSSFKLTAAAAALTAKVTEVADPGVMSQKLVVPLQKIQSRNEPLVRAAVTEIAKVDGRTWVDKDGKAVARFYNLANGNQGQVAVILMDKDGNADFYRIWCIDAAPVVYFLVPETPGDYIGTGIDTKVTNRGKYGRSGAVIGKIGTK